MQPFPDIQRLLWVKLAKYIEFPLHSSERFNKAGLEMRKEVPIEANIIQVTLSSPLSLYVENVTSIRS